MLCKHAAPRSQRGTLVLTWPVLLWDCEACPVKALGVCRPYIARAAKRARAALLLIRTTLGPPRKRAELYCRVRRILPCWNEETDEQS